MLPALNYANVLQAALIWPAHRVLADCLFPELATPAETARIGTAEQGMPTYARVAPECSPKRSTGQALPRRLRKRQLILLYAFY